MWQAYETPTSVDEALQILARYDGHRFGLSCGHAQESAQGKSPRGSTPQAQIIAGGTDLIIELQAGRRSVECLVDVMRIPGLDRIEQQGDQIVLGANVTFRQIKDSLLLQEQARVLSEAAGTVGALQIQTMATLAGNVASALPAADGCVALVALGAEVEIASVEGRAWQPVESLFLGPAKSAVDPRRQMITAIRFPAAGARQGSAWERIGRRRTLVLPILNCGVNLALSTDGQRLEWAKIGLGPVAPVPFRATETETFLSGKPASEETFIQAGEVAASEAQPRTSLLRASKEYRLEVLKVLVRNGLGRAVTQAQETTNP